LFSDFFAETYEAIGSLVLFTVALSYLEVIHPLLDLVKSPWQLPCLQVSQFSSVCWCRIHLKSCWRTIELHAVQYNGG